MKKFKEKFEKLCKEEGIDIVLNKIKHLMCVEHGQSPEIFVINTPTFSGKTITLHNCEELMKLVEKELGLTID